MFAAEVVVDTVEMEGDVDFSDALEWAEAKGAEQSGGADSGEFLEGGGLGDVRFERLDQHTNTARSF